MPTLTKQQPIRSSKIRNAAKGERCTIQLPGICSYDPATTVLCHVHDEVFGMAQKADDISGFFGCSCCHSAYDLHQTGLSPIDLIHMVFRAVQRTLRRLVERKIVTVPIDVQRKAKRLSRTQNERRERALNGGENFPAPGSFKKKIQSPGFNKNYRKKFDGTVEKR